MKLHEHGLYARLFEEFIDHTNGFSYQEVMNNRKVLRDDEDKKILDTVFKTAAKPDLLALHTASPEEREFYESLPIIGIKMTNTEYNNDGNKYVISYAGCRAYIEYLEHKRLSEIGVKVSK